MASTNPFWSFATPFTDSRPPASSGSLSGGPAHGDHIRVSSNDSAQSYAQTPPESAWSEASFQEVGFIFGTSHAKNMKSLEDTASVRSGDWPLTEKYYALSSATYDLRCPKWTLWKTILLPTSTIILPMAFLVAGLMALIFGYRVRSEDSLFEEVSNSQALSDHAVVLVNYSATRIAFVASWASTLAPLLAGFIMNLSSFQSALLMYLSSSRFEQQNLPTPYQYSLLVGLCLASMGRLRRYFSYAKEDGVVIPPALRRAARTLTLTLVLACVVFGADTALHYTTSTINFDRISVSTEAHAYGYELSSACLALNRSDNFGLPCSRNGQLALTDYNAYVSSQNEIFYLQHDTSTVSEVRLVDTPSYEPSNATSSGAAKVALLIPQSTGLSPFRDFQAHSTGVITTCEPITTLCNWTSGGPGNYYSQFNCSENFWGVLGKAPNVSDTGMLIDDSSVPPLGFKRGAALQYSFFMNKELSILYDAAGNLGPFMQDSELINPVYLGVAARFQSTAQRAGVNMSSDPGIYQGPTPYLDFTLRCQYTTYLVDYNWVNSSARINTLTPSPNGTIAEIFHGYNIYGSYDSFDNDLQDFILEAALQSNPQQMADSFANSYSSRVMSVIGPFLSSRTNLQEQTRTPLLVAKVPKVPLAILVTGCLCYIVFGVASATLAYTALRTVDVRDLAFRFSLPALGLHAFRDHNTEREAVEVDKVGKGTWVEEQRKVFNETKIKREATRVAIEGEPRTGFILKSLV
ncbi:uncharacterized protein Z520_04156 [Fonsecaea multimorphosa CBS 102226]|uniref:Uncharacterized protein n=1 Tax=Fonsecaea multimorphosa CBS 102226 TaxID=1442371 RepID=A0A0D2HF10_9EURO|nr:uncharacterized protein Z520_04156 [Fonsecaea multimorphosa CBS 102226]KIY00471.1 hypothetical protein Z520_04156 [Fonsecaea multimorphosa CBS 102226]OAL26985.1 hypothetical protein AYO22_03929 [Fonsecaea multimorphosa]